MDTIDELKSIIKEVAPEAEDATVYGVYGFKYKNKNLAAFALAQNHVGYYPMSPALIVKYKNDLKDLDTAKGTIRFPLDAKLPTALIRKIVKDRMEEIEDAVGSKR